MAGPDPDLRFLPQRLRRRRVLHAVAALASGVALYWMAEQTLGQGGAVAGPDWPVAVFGLVSLAAYAAVAFFDGGAVATSPMWEEDATGASLEVPIPPTSTEAVYTRAAFTVWAGWAGSMFVYGLVLLAEDELSWTRAFGLIGVTFWLCIPALIAANGLPAMLSEPPLATRQHVRLEHHRMTVDGQALAVGRADQHVDLRRPTPTSRWGYLTVEALEGALTVEGEIGHLMSIEKRLRTLPDAGSAKDVPADIAALTDRV